MDDVDPALLAHFPALRVAKLLYRSPVGAEHAVQLVETLQICARGGLAAVELRLHRANKEMVAVLAHVPCLRKVALFDAIVEGEGVERGVAVLERCRYLEEVQMEWVRGFDGRDLAGIARVLGSRLRRLRIWNCDDVCDDGLRAVAVACPFVDVELRFVRDQFDPRTLALFGDRVSWGSYML